MLLVAGATALLFYRLKQPVVLGYLLAGYLVGPFSPGPSFVGQGEVMGFLGELGIVFLLFALGLEFNLTKLRKVGATAILAGTLEIAIMLWLGYSLGRMFGWTPMEAIFLGAVMSISSTTIIVKVLSEMDKKEEDWAQVAFGILIMEDVLAVLILTGLSSAGASGNFNPELLTGLLWKLGIFLAAALVIGLMIAPRLVDYLARLKVEEVLVVVSVGVGFGLALLASELGFSAGLGAFVAGALMAESPRVVKIEHKIAPLRDVFTAIFFVTVGALVNPVALWENWLLIVAVTAGVLLGKVVSVSLALFATGQPSEKAIPVGMTLAQIGEFGFIIASLGVTLGVTPPSLYPVVIAVSVLTSFLTPYLIRASPAVTAFFRSRAPTGLRAYAAAYRAFLARLKKTDRADPEWRTVRRSVLIMSLNAAAVLAILAAGVSLSNEVRALGITSQFAALGIRGIEYVLIVVLASPFLVVWFNALKRLVNALARIAVPPRLRTSEVTGTERLLRHTFGFIAAVITGAFVLLVGSPLIGSSTALLLVIVGVSVNSILLGTSLQRYHREVENTLNRIIGSSGPTPAGGSLAQQAREEALHVIQDAGAWGAANREIRIPQVSGGAGRTIGDLRMRALTGASIVSVIRASDPHPHTNPGPEFRLHAGDRILLLGETEALTRAEEILLGRDLGVAGGATEITLAPGSPLAGHPLVFARVRERTGADVLVVRRGATPLEARADLVLAPGDVLVVAGTEAQVARLDTLVRQGPGQAGEEELPN